MYVEPFTRGQLIVSLAGFFFSWKCVTGRDAVRKKSNIILQN